MARIAFTQNDKSIQNLLNINKILFSIICNILMKFFVLTQPLVAGHLQTLFLTILN